MATNLRQFLTLSLVAHVLTIVVGLIAVATLDSLFELLRLLARLSHVVVKHVAPTAEDRVANAAVDAVSAEVDRSFQRNLISVFVLVVWVDIALFSRKLRLARNASDDALLKHDSARLIIVVFFDLLRQHVATPFTCVHLRFTHHAPYLARLLELIDCRSSEAIQVHRVKAIFKDPLIIAFFDRFSTHGALDDLDGLWLFG